MAIAKEWRDTRLHSACLVARLAIGLLVIMITYLKGGWYEPRSTSRMRTEVVDGAIDAAGMLFRAGVPVPVLASVGFKLRALVTLLTHLWMAAMCWGSVRGRRSCSVLSR